MSTTRAQIHAELVNALARRAESDEHIVIARAMLRALDLQDKDPKPEVKPNAPEPPK